MNRQFGRRSFYLTVLCAFAALLFTGTFAHGQNFYALDWTERFNNSAGNETQDNWVANSYAAANSGGSGMSKIVSVTLPIGDTFTNYPITALIYQGFDLADPTAGGGLMLMAKQDATFSSVLGAGSIVTVTFDTPAVFNAGDIFYAAVLIRGVTGAQFPFRNDGSRVINRSFYDAGLTFGGPYDINQLPAHSDNITVTGGVHPVLGGGIQSAGTIALWANGVAP